MFDLNQLKHILWFGNKFFGYHFFVLVILSLLVVIFDVLVIKLVYEIFNFLTTSAQKLEFYFFTIDKISLLLAIIPIIGAIIKFIHLRYLNNIVAKFGINLSLKLIERILKNQGNILAGYQPEHLGSLPTLKVESFLSLSLLPLLSLVSGVILIISISIFILIINPDMILFTLCILTLYYGITIFLNKSYLIATGYELKQAQEESTKYILAVVGFLNEIRNYDYVEKFLLKFKSPITHIRLVQARNNTIGLSPRIILEGIILSLIVIIISYVVENGNIAPDYAAIFAGTLGFVKIVPYFQQSYGSLVSLMICRDVVEDLHQFICSANCGILEDENCNYQSTYRDGAIVPSPVVKQFELHARGLQTSLEHPIEFNFGKTYYVSGQSGIGKSTFLKALSGQTARSLSFSHENFNNSEILYVSQESFFPFSTIFENMQVNGNEKFDEALFRQLMVKLEMGDFLDSLELSLGANLEQLSSGQRQRLSIIRSFLRPNIRIIIFDEITSRLNKKLADKITKHIIDHCTQRNMILVFCSHDQNVCGRFDYHIEFAKVSNEAAKIVKNEN